MSSLGDYSAYVCVFEIFFLFFFFVIRCGNILSIRYNVNAALGKYLLQYLLGQGGEILLYVKIKALSYVYLQGQIQN